MKQISRKKFITFAVLAVTMTLFGAFLILLGADLYLHQRFDKVAALNYRGYRGRVLGRKRSDELRVGIFGGSIAMGYGVTIEQAIAAQLEQILNARRTSGPHITVVNLASTSEAGPMNFASSYRAFRYLDLDVVALLFTEGPTFEFQRADVADWSAFLRKVRTQDAGHSKLIWSHLDPVLRNKIETGKETLSVRELNDVLVSLNTLAGSRVWFDRQWLQQELGEEGSDLVPKENESPMMVNRIMMERLYPELARFSDRFGQLPFSFRTGNWVFRRFGYWFILPTVLVEKYFQVVYKSVTEGYKKDKLVPWLSHLGLLARGETPRSPVADSGNGPPQESLADALDAIVREGKVFVFVFLPTVENSDLSASKRYAQQLAKRNDRVVVADVRASFLDREEESYFTDGQHYSEKANRAVAEAISPYITAERLPIWIHDAR